MNDSNIIYLSDYKRNKCHNKALKTLLDNLEQQYSLKSLIDCIISKATNKDNIECGNNTELNKIISTICKEIDVSEIFDCILDVQGEEQNININKSLNQNNGNDEEKNKRISLSTTLEEEPIEIKDINNNNPININDDDDENNSDIISLSESDDNNNLEKIIVNGLEKYSHTDKKGKKIKVIHINSDENNNEFDKKVEKFKNLSFHCSIIQGEYYKYKLKLVNNKGFAKYICFNPNCEGYGMYNINNKTFTLLKEHNCDNNNYCCYKNMDSQDKIYYSYMVNNNIEEMQILND